MTDSRLSLRVWMPLTLLSAAALTAAGCSDAPQESAAPSASSQKPAVESDSSGDTAATADAGNAPPRFVKPTALSSSDAAENNAGSGSVGATADKAPPKFDDVIAGLKPVQIVLGSWTGILKDASINEPHNWVWDLKSDPVFPALVLTVPEGHFFANARLTYDPRGNEYLMTTTGGDGEQRSYRGEFKAVPEDVVGEDGKTLQRQFELVLTEQEESSHPERFQFVFKQQNNDRYLLTVMRARGKAAFRQVDVVGTQRDGVSFAKASDDYGDRTCVISGGLGTMSVSYKGKSYFVCCTGCKAAFEDDPESWIARFEEAQMKK